MITLEFIQNKKRKENQRDLLETIRENQQKNLELESDVRNREELILEKNDDPYLTQNNLDRENLGLTNARFNFLQEGGEGEEGGDDGGDGDGGDDGDGEGDGEGGGGGKDKTNWAGIANAGAGAIGDTIAVFGNETDGSDKAGIANTAKLTTSYAGLGAQFGGYGALIGGIVGLATGLFRARSEREKANKRRKQAYLSGLDKDRRDREKMYRLNSEQQRIKNLIALQKSQLNYL